MNGFEQQIKQVREAFTASRMLPLQEGHEHLLENEANQAWEKQLSGTEHALFQQCRKYRSVGLTHARQGKYPLAEYLFGSVEKILQSGAFSQIGFLVAQAEYEAAMAYLDYRRGLYQSGTERIYRAMDSYRALEMLYGYRIFHLQRIRQLLNLLRLKRCQGNVEEAFAMAFALMDYLEQKIAVLPFPTVWDSRDLEDQSPLLKQRLFEQAVFEAAFLVAGSKENPPLFQTFLEGHLSASSSPTCNLSPLAHTWLKARLALHGQDTGCFLEQACLLLAAGPREIVWLWHATLLDLLLVCRELPGKLAFLFSQEVNMHQLGWPWSHFPPSWQKVVQKTSQPHICA